MIAYDETIEELVVRLGCMDLDQYVDMLHEICTRPALVRQLVQQESLFATDVALNLVQTKQSQLFAEVWPFVQPRLKPMFIAAAYKYGKQVEVIHVVYPDGTAEDDEDYYEDEVHDWVKKNLHLRHLRRSGSVDA